MQIPKTSAEFRIYLFGIMTGIIILIGSVVAVCEIVGVRFQFVILQ